MTKITVLMLLLAGCHKTYCLPPEDAAWSYAVLIHVEDATTQQPIPNPTFAVEGQAVMATCYDPGSTDLASVVCPGWSIGDEGNFTLDVDAPGYREGSVAIDSFYTLDGCPARRQIEQSIELSPTP